MVRALASYQCGLGTIPGFGVMCELRLLLVHVLAPERVFPGARTPVFLPPQKPIFLNLNRSGLLSSTLS